VRHSLCIGALVAIVCCCGRANRASAQWADPTYVSAIGGVQLDGRECVPACRDLAKLVLNKGFPFLGANGLAADLWTTACPGWQKIANSGRNLPTNYGVVIWNKQLAGTGHLAFVIGIADPAARKLWVIDANWFKGRGAIHTVTIDGRVAGWMQ
jgi:hypothetical protein